MGKNKSNNNNNSNLSSLKLDDKNHGKVEKTLRQWQTELQQQQLKLQHQQSEHQQQQDKLQQQQDKLQQQQSEQQQYHAELKRLQFELTKQRSELNKERIRLEKLEMEAQGEFPNLFEKQFSSFKRQLEEREATYLDNYRDLEAEKEELRKREAKVRLAEIQRDNGFADKRAELDNELLNIKEDTLQNLEDQRISRLEAEKTALETMRQEKVAELEEDLSDARDEVEQARKSIQEKEGELADKEEDLSYREDRLKTRNNFLSERERSLDEEVDERITERIESLEANIETSEEEIERLRESLKRSDELIFSFEDLQAKLGDEDPAIILLKLKTYEESIKSLREDLATRPPSDMKEEFDALRAKEQDAANRSEMLLDENISLRKELQPLDKLEMENASLADENKSLQRKFELLELDRERLTNELSRHLNAYVRASDYDKRKASIETPYLTEVLPRNSELKDEAKRFLILQQEITGLESADNKKKQEYLDLGKKIGSYEKDWLAKIEKSCVEYGLKFPRRILYAFHTALKTAEWSPLTVLSGVSGTGKSELPRLYSHFGGINFLSLAVQSNWDSQESMLGFFNSMENEFDAQEVLKFLVQSQIEPNNDNTNGLKDVMNLVLMDEMNIAHVEHYFAEFLSKLETRRGMKGSKVPHLPVKLGVGSNFIYQLPLGRNVLWSGTMNQDETTNSLSDKVLDRGIVINFPRPTSMERRTQLKPLGEQANLLSREVWESWWSRSSQFTDDQIEPFKSLIERINNSLDKVGRALGHRVWQSIEYYMANYPDVLEAQRAIESQGENGEEVSEADKNGEKVSEADKNGKITKGTEKDGNTDNGKATKDVKDAKKEEALEQAMKIAFEDQLAQKVMPKLRGIETRGVSKSECLDPILEQLKDGGYKLVEDFELACTFGDGYFNWNSARYLQDDRVIDAESTSELLEPKG